MDKYIITKMASEPRTVQYTDKKTNQPKSFQTIGFQVKDNPNWINISYNETVMGWKVGDEVAFKLAETVKDGKTFYNAKLPDAISLLTDKVNALTEEVNKIKEHLKTKSSENVAVLTDLPWDK